eukprot:8434174-Alexandrium_andersonii.AAC.1
MCIRDRPVVRAGPRAGGPGQRPAVRPVRQHPVQGPEPAGPRGGDAPLERTGPVALALRVR